MRIRNAFESGDVGALTRLHADLYRREYGYGVPFEAYCAQGIAELALAHAPDRDRIWLCEEDDALVGSLFLADRGAATAQLRFFLVAPSHRGQGLGKRLMDAFMDAFDTLGYTHAYLWTTNDLATAASLYTRHGFVLAESVPSERFGKSLVEQKYELRRGS